MLAQRLASAGSVLGLTVALTGWVGAAAAHGYWPAKHGGLMNLGGEITMELTNQEGRLVIYVEDHGEPVDMQAADGTLEILEVDGAKSAITLRPAGGNRVEGRMLTELKPGLRLIAILRFSGGIEYRGRFRVDWN